MLRSFLISVVLIALLFTASFASAGTFPEQLKGAWGGRAEFQGDDREVVAKKACDSYWKNRNAVTGDVLVFEATSKSSFGGYADYVDTNVSVEILGPNRWRISDRHFQDEEGGATAGNGIVRYEATIDGNTLTIKDTKSISRFNRCVTPSEKSPPYVKLSSADGECQVTLDVADLKCTARPIYMALQNGSNLISFPNSRIAVVSFAGAKITQQPGSSRVLWVDRVYLNQNMQLADGQCSLSIDTEPQKLECRAVLRDGRKLDAVLVATKVDENFLVPMTAASGLNRATCKKIIETHGFLSRAQQQCGFSRYSGQMLQASKECTRLLTERDQRSSIEAGMRAFGKNERTKGRPALCAEVLRRFPNIVSR